MAKAPKLQKAKTAKKPVDPQRSAALRGNNNAAGPHMHVTVSKAPAARADHGGARIGAISTAVFGATGSLVSGAVISGRSQRAKIRHAKASGIVGSVNGAIVGTLVGAAAGGSLGAVGGGLAGAAVSGGIGYGAARLGHAVGGAFSGKSPEKKAKK